MIYEAMKKSKEENEKQQNWSEEKYIEYSLFSSGFKVCEAAKFNFKLIRPFIQFYVEKILPREKKAPSNENV